MQTTMQPRPKQLSRWWRLKVICSLLLSVNLALHFIVGRPAEWMALPLMVSQGIVLLGGVIFLMHYGMLRRMNPDISRPAALLSERGLFRRIRHPMYFGEIILNLGLASFAIHPLSLVIWLISVLSIYRQSLVEDLALERSFGDEFSAWERRTNLLLPFIRQTSDEPRS